MFRVFLCLAAQRKGMVIKMKLKSTLIVVKDIEKALKFYQELFGLTLLADNDGNLIEVGTPM